MVNKFEAIGIGVSIMAMAIAIFLLRLETTETGEVQTAGVNQAASVVVGETGTDRERFGVALSEAVGSSGKIERLIIDDIVLGDGEVVDTGSEVTVHYIGTLQNGQEFDNSYKRGTPFSFTIGEGKAIAGWEEGVKGMKGGGQRILIIPSDMAYGDDGFGPIPGGATLVFAIELLSVN